MSDWLSLLRVLHLLRSESDNDNIHIYRTIWALVNWGYLPKLMLGGALLYQLRQRSNRHAECLWASRVLAMVTAQLSDTKGLMYRKGVQFATALGYYALLCLVDETILAPAFGYQGLAYRSTSTWTQVGVAALIFLCTAVTPARMRQPSDGVLYVLLPLVVIPVIVVGETDVMFANVAWNLIISVVGAYLILGMCAMLPRPSRDPVQRLSLRRPWLLVTLLSLASYGLMFRTFGLHIQLLSFSDVYDVRAAFTEQASGVAGYLVDWQANVINPLFIVYGIRYRRVLWLAAGVLGDLIIYSTTGYKSVLFSVLAIVAFLIALRQKASRSKPGLAGVRLGLAFAALVAIAYVIDSLNNSIIWTSLFVRRLSLVAGVNTGYYFQYFSSEPKTHLAYGVVGTVLGRTGATSPTAQIATAIYHAPGDPNANLWADAYANFGHVGVVLFTLVLAGFLWFYDLLARNVERSAAAVLIVAPSLSLANSALFTCFLTHGMLLALVLITQWPRMVPPVGAPGQSEDQHAGRSRTGLVRPTAI